MAASVLFDAPGPRTRVRYRLYAVLSTAALAAILALILWRLWQAGQFDPGLWEPFVTPRIVNALLWGLGQTLLMAVVAVIGAVLLGALLGIAKLSDHPPIRWPAWLFVEFFRAVPLFMLILGIWYLIGPQPGWHGYWAVVLGLWLYNGSVIAEITRAGIHALPKGQSEAAYALGMRKGTVMQVVLLPQAVKIMLPAIISQSIVALKDTSLGYAVLAPGLTFIGKQVFGEFRNIIPTALVMAAVYITLNLMLTWLATWAQRRYAGEKKIEVSVAGADVKGAKTATL
ncbi:MAG TPA: amino acid ABC transporter permease [Aeromicrobium sp.]|nr:amino acid ABC transporter permease [Aeromicrobium sp.]